MQVVCVRVFFKRHVLKINTVLIVSVSDLVLNTCHVVTCWIFLHHLLMVQVTPAVFIDSSVPPSLLLFHLKLEISSMERERWGGGSVVLGEILIIASCCPLSSVERYVSRLKIEQLQRPSNRARGSFLHTDTHTYNLAYFFHVIVGKKDL